MSKPDYEKRDEPVTFRTSERKAAWLNDVARVQQTERSALIDQILTDWLESTGRTRTPECTQQIESDLSAMECTLKSVRKQVRMLMAVGMIGAGRRRTA